MYAKAIKEMALDELRSAREFTQAELSQVLKVCREALEQPFIFHNGWREVPKRQKTNLVGGSHAPWEIHLYRN